MALNLELKARIPSLSQAVKIAKRLTGSSPTILHQVDLYYKIPKGRLKLRIINRRRAELIFYQRPNKKGGRYSRYLILPLEDVQLARLFFATAFQQRICVEKKRHLFLYKNARIHLDEVTGLGSFLEFEIVVQGEKRQARQLFLFLKERFHIQDKDVLAGSYSDLLMRAKA